MSVKESNIDRFIYAMFNMMNGFKKGVEHCCAEYGDLSEKEFMIINLVGQAQSAKMSEIAHHLSAPLSTVTSIVDRLVVKKFLVRYHANDDRRVVLVALASKGKDSFQKFSSFRQDVAKKVLSNFKEQEQESMIAYLEKIPTLLE